MTLRRLLAALLALTATLALALPAAAVDEGDDDLLVSREKPQELLTKRRASPDRPAGSGRAARPAPCSRSISSQREARSSMFRLPLGVTEEACRTMPELSMITVARSSMPGSAR